MANDTISRQAAIDAIENAFDRETILNRFVRKIAISAVRMLPSAQPERTCVNCGRTANNGGWYADGGTRCPIEEHYRCSECGAEFVLIFGTPNDNDYLYCPHCGARMDGDHETD